LDHGVDRATRSKVVREEGKRLPGPGHDVEALAKNTAQSVDFRFGRVLEISVQNHDPAIAMFDKQNLPGIIANHKHLWMPPARKQGKPGEPRGAKNSGTNARRHKPATVESNRFFRGRGARANHANLH